MTNIFIIFFFFFNTLKFGVLLCLYCLFFKGHFIKKVTNFFKKIYEFLVKYSPLEALVSRFLLENFFFFHWEGFPLSWKIYTWRLPVCSKRNQAFNKRDIRKCVMRSAHYLSKWLTEVGRGGTGNGISTRRKDCFDGDQTKVIAKHNVGFCSCCSGSVIIVKNHFQTWEPNFHLLRS